MTVEDFKVLEEYEDIFSSAINSGYYRNLTLKALRNLNDIYERLTGHRYRANGWGCPHCNFRFICIIGNMYFEEKKKQIENLVKPQASPKPASDKKAHTKAKANNKKKTTKK